MPSGIVSGAGKPKDSVNYRQHEKCKTCVNFYPLNSCVIVDGNISSDAVCDDWAIKTPSQPKDGDYYLKEHQRMMKGLS